MTMRVLVPVDGIEDAEAAIRGLPNVLEPGDEVVLLAVAEEPDAELIGSQPGEVIPGNPYIGAAGSLAPVQPNDVPVFMSSEEIIEREGRELREALESRASSLRALGMEVRVDSFFSDERAEAILSYARNIEPTNIAATQHTYDDMLSDAEIDTPIQVLSDEPT
jgi:hypothetical protein